jgi:hypothetical protein
LVINLPRRAGNRAVAGLLQRHVGWKDAWTKTGRGWNADEHLVGKVRRIPLEGLGEGLGGKPTKFTTLSPETAEGKAIVLIPEALDATKPIEVLVFLHGYTEHRGRPYAGWRTLTDPAPSLKDLDPDDVERLPRLRQGVDPAELPGVADVAPVRDVALDQAEQQLQESGRTQLVIMLPQGGLRSQFSKDGEQNFDAGAFVPHVVNRLVTEDRWKDAAKKVVKTAPVVSRVNMAGHSGAGQALAGMANQYVTEATSKKKPKPGAPRPPNSALTGDLVIYDAINGGQFWSFQTWALRRLEEDLAVLSDKSKTDTEKFAYLQTAPKLRGYTTDSYISAYKKLDAAIGKWFDDKKAKLGAFAPCLRANYTFEYVDVHHEELMRGSRAGTKRAAGTGTILDAIKGLNSALLTSTADCPAMPKSLTERYEEEQKKKRERKKARAQN